jgi:hypothetical protein
MQETSEMAALADTIEAGYSEKLWPEAYKFSRLRMAIDAQKQHDQVGRCPQRVIGGKLWG